MELRFIIFKLVTIGVFCYAKYDTLPSKYIKPEESSDGFMKKTLVRFDIEKSPMHTIVYGASNTGKTYFVNNTLICIEKTMKSIKK